MTNIDDLDFTPALARCARCRRPAPILEADVAGDGQGDPNLDVVTPTPHGWHAQLDDADEPTGESVCSACSTPSEREATADDRHVTASAVVKALNDDHEGEGRPWEPSDVLDVLDDEDDDDVAA
jgi:hypothetical protein